MCEICPILQLSSLKEVVAHKREIHMDKEGKLICPQCDKRTTEFGNLASHIDAKHPSHGEKKFPCDVCDKKFIFEKSLYIHKFTHKEKDKVCTICGYKTLATRALDHHMIIKHNDKTDKKYMCNECDFSAISGLKLTKHKSYFHKKDLRNCPYCKESFRQNQKLHIHIDSKHQEQAGVPQFFCENCVASYIFKASLDYHKTAKCKATRTRRSLKSSIHLGCDYCKKILTTSKMIKMHYKNMHPGKDIIADGVKRYNCSNCDDFFFTNFSYDRHLNLAHEIQTDKNKRYCEKCKKPYFNEHNCPKDRKMFPSMISKNLCNQCGVYYKGNQALKLHISSVHDGLRFQCDFCDQIYKQEINLNSHIKTVHENCQEFKCTPCEKIFGSQKKLRDHTWQSHTQVSCETCGKQVANKSSLKKHMYFVHDVVEGIWLCEKCPKSVFLTQITLDKHISDKHSQFS